MLCDVCGVTVNDVFYELVEKNKQRIACDCCMADLADSTVIPIYFQSIKRRDYTKYAKRKRS